MQDRPPPRKHPFEDLNGAQLAEVERRLRDFAANQQLKQWCVAQALTVRDIDPVELAMRIYDFLMELPTVIEAQEQ